MDVIFGAILAVVAVAQERVSVPTEARQSCAPLYARYAQPTALEGHTQGPRKSSHAAYCIITATLNSSNLVTAAILRSSVEVFAGYYALNKPAVAGQLSTLKKLASHAHLRYRCRFRLMVRTFHATSMSTTHPSHSKTKLGAPGHCGVQAHTHRSPLQPRRRRLRSLHPCMHACLQTCQSTWNAPCMMMQSNTLKATMILP